MTSQTERILILAKTYPSPSARYFETSCVAGITQDGQMRRLFPVPFRMLNDHQQFQKWQWIDVRVDKARIDHRQESYRVSVDTVECGERIGTAHGWAERQMWLQRAPHCQHVEEIPQDISLALLRPGKLLRLEITPARHKDWTPEEQEKLMRAHLQASLFEDPADAQRDVATLRKLPFDFYYHYECDTSQGRCVDKHKIVDWEVGALFWNCWRTGGEKGWEQRFRDKLETEFQARDMVFLMGNIHRFRHQWLIISLIYPPKADAVRQGTLF